MNLAKNHILGVASVFAFMMFFLDMRLFFAVSPSGEADEAFSTTTPVENENLGKYNIEKAQNLIDNAENKADELLRAADELIKSQEDAAAVAAAAAAGAAALGSATAPGGDTDHGSNNELGSDTRPAGKDANCPPLEYEKPTWSDLADPSGPKNMHLPSYSPVLPEFSDRNQFLINAASQSSEDIFSFDTFFKSKTDGVFLEMGALDGHKFSNTIKHDKYLKWRGVLIEPHPDNYNALKKTRAGQALFHAASCGECMQVHFAKSAENAVGGIWEFMTERFKRVWFPSGNTNPIPLTCMPLHLILETVKVNHVNFFSLDVEGAELEVIKGIDWDRFSFDVMVMERDNPKRADPDLETLSDTAQIIEILTSKGYRVYDDHHGDVHLASSHDRNIWIVK